LLDKETPEGTPRDAGRFHRWDIGNYPAGIKSP
jgi:hypothetical protein